ncbi:MAG: hypothetical protein WCK77_06460 [Verrucomicrobiota bacterium]
MRLRIVLVHQFFKDYMRWTDQTAVVVASNPGNQPANITLLIDPAVCGWNTRELHVTDLWGGTGKRALSVDSSGKVSLTVTIAPDKTPGGGLAVFLIRPVAYER